MLGSLTSILGQTQRFSANRVDQLCDAERQRGTVPGQLGEVLSAFLSEHHDSVIGTSRVINPLLDLWAVAHEESEEVARPIERMLTVLVNRQHTSGEELARMVGEIEEAARSDGAEREPSGAASS